MPDDRTLEESLLAISRAAFRDEAECVRDVLQHTAVFREKSEIIATRARGYVETIRAAGESSGTEAFLQRFGLHTKEGIAILSLAEALLRIPDNATADALIRDKLGDVDLEKLTGGASAWGLKLTGYLAQMEESSFFGRVANRAGAPVVRTVLKKGMAMLGGQFVLGETIAAALKRAKKLEAEGYLFSFDMLGEGARTAEQAERYFALYLAAVDVVSAHARGTTLWENPGISVKLSALHPRYELVQKERVIAELLPRVVQIMKSAREKNIAVSIDAEEAGRLDIELELFAALLTDPQLAGYSGIGFVLQAYQKRALPVLDFLVERARAQQRRIPVRLVKGAYWDSEIKRAQEAGLPGYPVFTRKCHTDASYLACAAKLLEHPDLFYPQFATHNAHTVAAILEIAGGKEFEFQRLYGMGGALHDRLVKEQKVRIYAPVGDHQELLPYLIRRLLENGANSSFVNQVLDETLPLDDLLRDPLAESETTQGTLNTAIPLPRAIYPYRNGGRGYDFGNRAQLQELADGIARFRTKTWEASPIINGKRQPGKASEIHSPHDVSARVGTAQFSKSVQVEQALAAATEAFPGWNVRSFSERADLLDRAAALYETHRNELLALLAREAGKTLADSVSELREAVDFLRYYAAEARALEPGEALPGPTGESNHLYYTGKGVFACISPWNFPLAIFTGQIAAALVAGNTVIAKPAEQTPLVAGRAVELLLEAGIPAEVLQLLPGSGETVGATLTQDVRIAGAAFTGSTATAQAINRSLAWREDTPPATLIAETGGQNCMIVDSSTLPEQAVDDILLSAFGSAGQRCSALRVLYMQEEIADKMLEFLTGAMQERRIGDPADPATDLGAVIDANARDTLLAHIEKMKKNHKLIASTPLPNRLENNGYFVAPHVFEIPSISVLEDEVFGPVLHIIRYRADALEEVIAQINGTGYGLTFGLHSRIAERWEKLRHSIRAGNIYINRSMIGAVVGVQPFGGMMLSGTGPKAGGANYLKRFLNEQVLTINTTAIGGNIGLLA